MLTRTTQVHAMCTAPHTERQRARLMKLLPPAITQQSENNSVPARGLPLEREIIQEPSRVTAPSYQGCGASRELLGLTILRDSHTVLCTFCFPQPSPLPLHL